MSRLISESLPGCARNRDSGALKVIDLEFGAGVLAEIEFVQTSIKVLLIDVLIDADKATLHGVFRRRTVRVTISPPGEHRSR